MRRILQVLDQSSNTFQRFRAEEGANIYHDIMWQSGTKSWTEANNDRPVDGINRTISIELSSEVW